MTTRSRRLLSSALVGLALLLGFSSCATTMDRSELAVEYYNLGTAYLDLGDFERSADYFSRALELDESLARASYNLARVYVVQGRYDDARNLLESLREQEPQNTIVLETLAYVAYSEGDAERALDYYDSVLQIDPGNINAIYNSALISFESDDPERSVVLLRRGRETDPEDTGMLGLLARVENQLGNTDDAIGALEDLRDLGAADPESTLLLASLYEEIERYDRALEELDTLVGTGDEAVVAEAQFLRARILLTAAEEVEEGLLALAAALDAGYADTESLGSLLEDPALPSEGEVRDLIESYVTLDRETGSGQGSAGETGRADDETNAVPESTPADAPESPSGDDNSGPDGTGG